MMPEKSLSMITTSQAAKLAAVTPTTIKRWADQGLLDFTRTAGGHYRFKRASVEAFLRQQALPTPPSMPKPVTSPWIQLLVSGREWDIEARLMETRARLGAWWLVADEIGAILVELGLLWQTNQVTVAEEHIASASLARAMARIGHSFPMPVHGRQCLLACPGEEDHELGLALVELCLREAAFRPVWMGRRSPVASVVQMIQRDQFAMVALSASAASHDGKALAAFAEAIGSICRERNVSLVLGGAGAWPSQPAYGVRVNSCAELRGFIDQRENRE